MNSMEFDIVMRMTYDELVKLSNSKGIEYSGCDDRLANFKRLSNDLGMSPYQILWVYLAKHLDSIRSYITMPQRELSEPINGRIDDAILYLILLKCLILESNFQERGRISTVPDQTMGGIGGVHSAARGSEFSGNSGSVVFL